MRVVAANRAMQAVWNFDFVRERRIRTPGEMTMFAVGRRCSFLDRITNWPVSFRAAAEMRKARAERLRLPSGMAEMMEAMREISGGDEALLKKLVRVWTAAKAAPTRIQSDFPVVWADPEHGEMRFRSIISVVSERDLLSFRDWHPVDAESWRVLEQVKTSWPRRRKNPTSAQP